MEKCLGRKFSFLFLKKAFLLKTLNCDVFFRKTESLILSYRKFTEISYKPINYQNVQSVNINVILFK